MFLSSAKEINTLISKRMSYIYLKVTIEKKKRTHNFDFLSLTGSSPGQSPGQVSSSLTHVDIEF